MKKPQQQESEIKYRCIFDTAKDGILILDAETGMMEDVNPFLSRLLGYPREHFIGKKVWELGFLKDVFANQDNFRELQQKGYIRYEDLPLETADGRRIDVEFVGNVYEADYQKVIQCNIRDITERKKLETILQRQREELQTIIDSVPAWIFYKNTENRFVRVNRAFAEIMEMSKENLEGKSLFELYPRDKAEAFWKDDKEVIASGKPKTNIIESIVINKETYWVQTEKIPYRDTQGNIIGIIGFSVDITVLKQWEEELKALTLTDELTKVYNRRGFMTLAQQALNMAKRLKKKACVLFVDVDNMKWTNDHFGHQEGDMLLINTASILDDTFRESDIVARISGDEFVVFALQPEEMSSTILPDRLKENLTVWNTKSKRRYEVALSIGWSRFDPENPVSLEDLIEEADRDMYENKRMKRKDTPEERKMG